MLKKIQKNLKSPENGFTLVELSIVLIIAGLILSTMMASINYYMGNKALEKTLDVIETSQTALFMNQYVYGFYPCPADPTLGPDNPMYGRSDCGSINVMKVRGRDVDGDGAGEEVLIGALPFNTLLNPDGNESTNDAAYEDYAKGVNPSLDGWHNKLTYAVTRSLTDDVDGFNQDAGAIDVVDENNGSILSKPGTAHLVIVSHGENGLGAYTENGSKVDDCIDSFNPDATPVLGAGTGLPTERDNCDFEIGPSPRAAVFLSALRRYDEDDPYDDTVKYLVTKVTDMWAYTGKYYSDNGTPNDFSDDIVFSQAGNTNGGNVGVGIKSPQERLHVQGDIQAFEMHVEGVCDGQGADCMPPEVLGGEVADMQCPNGKIVSHIEENKVTCSNPFTAASYGACPTGKFLVGISSKYGPICNNLY